MSWSYRSLVHVTAFELAIMEEAGRHSRRLGTIAINGSNASWKHDELIREVRHAYGAPRQEALARLAELNASYGNVLALVPSSCLATLGL